MKAPRWKVLQLEAENAIVHVLHWKKSNDLCGLNVHDRMIELSIGSSGHLILNQATSRNLTRAGAILPKDRSRGVSVRLIATSDYIVTPGWFYHSHRIESNVYLVQVQTFRDNELGALC
jgi:hypothetical protein